jgi:predicted enzyme related to lactoylglutathione lyase
MKRVTGIGGIFFKAKDKDKLLQWYAKHLGISMESWGGAILKWAENDPKKDAITVFSIFPETTKYLEPGKADFMINFRVENLDELVKALKEEGVPLSGEPKEEFNGKFAWVIDPEGNKIELWEPK